MSDSISIKGKTKAYFQQKLTGSTAHGTQPVSIGKFHFLPSVASDPFYYTIPNLAILEESPLFQIPLNSVEKFWCQILPLWNPMLILAFGSTSNVNLTNGMLFYFFCGWDVTFQGTVKAITTLREHFVINASHPGPFEIPNNFLYYRGYMIDTANTVSNNVRPFSPNANPTLLYPAVQYPVLTFQGF